MHYLTKLNFYQWLAISLLLHLSLALPFLWTTLHFSKQHRQEMLKIEIYGMISNRQMEERHKGEKNPRQVPQPEQAANNAPVKPSSEKSQNESPVRIENADVTPLQLQATPVMVTSPAGAETEQKQQTVNLQAVLNEYAGQVGRKVRGNLVYPKEVRENGLTGTAKIAFTITSSGEIREGTLRVIKSSGHASLDNSALQAAQASAPFDAPPGGAIDVAVNVYFDRDS
ncbi:TonB family protein [Sporomusa sp. KB1]|uniref:TonB family protein n=1 Tax=Sporomusa sp. KB1 TaxID=943346 RepID=UPI0011A48552|nr:TonB family protein [Sporomusa sp. KB1]TWH45068.1 TonB family protein [Sporomusa sp. KB1]